MLQVNNVVRLGDNRDYVVQNELLYNGQIYYVLATSEDGYNEKIFTECVEYDGDKYIRVVESEDVAIELAKMLNQ
jgi:hypothetical protein